VTGDPARDPAHRRVERFVKDNTTAVAIAVYAIAVIAAVLVAYYTIFTYLAPYDDEGTLLVTLKAFVHGDALYKEIWSVYGPFFYEVFGAFFKVTGASITTDASRSIVVLVWVGASLLFGLAAHRLTGRLSLGITALIATFATLNVLDNEPMHPQGLCILLLAGFALVAACGGGRRNVWSGAGCGALLAALLLTKVNLGVFAIAGAVLAVFLTVGPLQRRTWLRWLVVVAYLAIPTVVMARDLRQPWVREFIIVELLAAVAVLVAARSLRPPRDDDDGGTLRWVLAGLAGFVALFVAVIVVILLTGPSPHDLYEGMIKGAFDIRDVLDSQFGFPPGSTIDWGIASVAAAAVASHLRARGTGATSIWPGLLRGGVGLAILLGVAHLTPVALNPTSQNSVVIPLLLAWVVAIPPSGVEESRHKRLLRALLPLVTIALTLQVYPVPGSQIGIASASFVPIGALCIADGLAGLRAWSTARGPIPLQNFVAAASALAIAVPAAFAINVLLLPGVNNVIGYHDNTELALPGANLMRIGASQADEYEALVQLLHEHDCSTFVGYPTVNSLYLWSGLEPPKPTMPNAWFYALNDSQQALALRELKASPRPCAIKDEELAGSYLKGLPPPEKPLVEYVLKDFTPIAKVGSFEFELPKPAATGKG
jgi:hypothetical protein